MQELKEAKFPRTGKEYKLEKTETGFNLRLIDLDDELKPIFKTYQQLLEMSQSGQILFTGFEEKKDEAELILLNLIHQTEISSLQAQLQKLEADKNEEISKLGTENTTLRSEIEELKSEIENQKAIIIGLNEAKDIAAVNS